MKTKIIFSDEEKNIELKKLAYIFINKYVSLIKLLNVELMTFPIIFSKTLMNTPSNLFPTS